MFVFWKSLNRTTCFDIMEQLQLQVEARLFDQDEGKLAEMMEILGIEERITGLNWLPLEQTKSALLSSLQNLYDGHQSVCTAEPRSDWGDCVRALGRLQKTLMPQTA